MNNVQIKIWQRGPQDWCWKVRSPDIYSGRLPIARGKAASSRAKAKDAAREAIRLYELQESAKWSPLST